MSTNILECYEIINKIKLILVDVLSDMPFVLVELIIKYLTFVTLTLKKVFGGSKKSDPKRLKSPEGMTSDGKYIYVCDTLHHKIKSYDRKGNIKIYGGNQKGKFNVPTSIKIHNNNFYVIDSMGKRIQIFDLEMKFVNSFKCHLGCFNMEFIDSYIYTTNTSIGGISIYTPKGKFIKEFGSLYKCECICAFNDKIYVTHSWPHVIGCFSMSGEYIGKIDNHIIKNPSLLFKFNDLLLVFDNGCFYELDKTNDISRWFIKIGFSNSYPNGDQDYYPSITGLTLFNKVIYAIDFNDNFICGFNINYSVECKINKIDDENDVDDFDNVDDIDDVAEFDEIYEFTRGGGGRFFVCY